MVGFAVLQGPLAHLKHITSPERLPFSGAYFGSLALTLYFAIARQAYLPTLICAIVQCAALVTYFLSNFPGGTTTLIFGARMATRGAGAVSGFLLCSRPTRLRADWPPFSCPVPPRLRSLPSPF